MQKLDPQNTMLDCVFFDGAGDVQKAGRILAAINPRITVLHGAEHVVSLFCKDAAQLTPIKVVIQVQVLVSSVWQWIHAPTLCCVHQVCKRV